MRGAVEFRHRLMSIVGKKGADMSNYMTIEALEDGLTAKMTLNDLEYSINGGTWNTLAADTYTPAISKGSFISFRKDNPSIEEFYGIGTFTISKKCNLLGNCLSLIKGDNAANYNYVDSYGFYGLFDSCSSIISVSKDFLPCQKVYSYAYNRMFNACTNLIQAPDLPATDIDNNCYSAMFNNCSSLRVAPDLPAEVMMGYCYQYMFYNCTSLEVAPIIGAKTIAKYCFSYMFYGCTSLEVAPKLSVKSVKEGCCYCTFRGCTNLTQAPVLEATTLDANSCYRHMFSNCPNLSYIKMMARDVVATNCLTSWVDNVSPTGTFVKSKDATWNEVGVNGVPSGWTIVLE